MDTKITKGSGTGSFTCNITGLTAGTKYYVRAYAKNSKGTAYGNQVTLTTTAYGLPTVTTSAVTNVSYTTVTCGGNVTADGGQTVTERGICYSTSQNPTTSNTKITKGSGIGSFTCNITGLTAGTKYYIRAYAKNSKGTAYGTQQVFSTVAPSVPTIITDSVKIESANSFVGYGHIDNSNGASVTQYGICWNTSGNPTINNSHTSSTGSATAFTSEATGIALGTTYYVRAYAKNSAGVGYGNVITFKTPSLPSITDISSSYESYYRNGKKYFLISGSFRVNKDEGVEILEAGYYASCSSDGLSNINTISSYSNGYTTNHYVTCNLNGATLRYEGSYEYSLLYVDYYYQYIRPYVETNIGTVWGSIHTQYGR